MDYIDNSKFEQFKKNRKPSGFSKIFDRLRGKKKENNEKEWNQAWDQADKREEEARKRKKE